MAEDSAVTVVIRFDHHHFIPQKIEIPSGKPILLTVVNVGNERIEFESFKLHREKVIEPGRSVVIHLPALRPGNYDFFDDFHEDVPEGVMISR